MMLRQVCKNTKQALLLLLINSGTVLPSITVTLFDLTTLVVLQ